MSGKKALKRAIEAHLDTKHSTLWLDWDISRPSRRALAVEHMAEEVAAILQHIDQHTTVDNVKLSIRKAKYGTNKGQS